MPLRGGDRGSSPFKSACDRIRAIADRVYDDNSSKAQACKRVVDTAERTVTREDHTPDYNPYQVLANRLKADFPEVWEGDERNSAQRVLSRWGVS